MDALDRISQRFPLVARPRPACQPLDVRVREVCELAQAAAGQTGADRLSLAATAHNKAALIASDCGLPDLARSMCWQQFDVYLQGQPMGPQAARHALEPVVNLARLLIRSGDGEDAYQLLDRLYQAVRSRTDALIDGTPVSFGNLIASDEDHRTLCRWLWTVLLADGTRALASAGRWDLALAHAEKRSGVGQRLLDGRQIAVLARCIAGDFASALAVLRESAVTAPWEQAVASCLTVLCLRSGARAASSAVAAMAEDYLRLERAPELMVFRVRLGLTVIDLAGGTEQPDAAQAASHLVGEAVATEDGYAARDILMHNGCKVRMTGAQEQILFAAVQSSGLGRGVIPAHLMADLLSAAEMSEAAAARTLAAPFALPPLPTRCAST